MFNIHPRTALAASSIFVFVALITFLPSVQFMPDRIVWFNDKQRLLELLLLGLILVNCVVVVNVSKTEILINKKISMALLLLLTLACISTLIAKSPRHAMVEISVFAALCYLGLFVANLYIENKTKFIQWFMYAIWGSILLYMISFYTGYITATVFKTPVNWPQPFNGFTNVRSFNQYQLWTLGIITLPLLTFELKHNLQRWLYVGMAFWWVLLFYSASRGVLLAWFSGMLITAVIYRNLARPFLRLQLIGAFAGYCIYYILFKAIPSLLQTIIVTGTVIRDTANDRIALWDQAVILIQDNPVFGVGPMHYAWHNLSNGHPHNSILQLGAEWGLPATVIILAITGYGFSSWFKQFNATQLALRAKSDYNLAIILFFTVMTNAAYSLVDGVIVSPISQILMFTFIGLMIGQYISEKGVVTNHSPRLRPIIAGITLIAMVWSTFPEIANGLAGKEKGFSMGYTATGPRFWREVK